MCSSYRLQVLRLSDVKVIFAFWQRVIFPHEISTDPVKGKVKEYVMLASSFAFCRAGKICVGVLKEVKKMCVSY